MNGSYRSRFFVAETGQHISLSRLTLEVTENLDYLSVRLSLPTIMNETVDREFSD